MAARSALLMRTALLLTGDRSEAEDLLQATLIKTYLSWDRIRDRAALDGYVRRTMVNINISWWRRRRLREFPTAEPPDTAVSDHTVRSALHDVLDRLLDVLPARQRAAVVLRYYEDLSEAEIAKVLGITVGAVKSSVSRGMARLRQEADRQAPDAADAGEAGLSEW
jgi:RNA polymerase sigma-70 factor (sigma-E family)